MKVKRIIGLCICAVGIYIVTLAIHGMHQVAEAKGTSQSISDFFEHNPGWWNPMIEFFGGQAQEEINRGDTRSIMALIGGICLTVLGAVMAIGYKSPKPKQ